MYITLWFSLVEPARLASLRRLTILDLIIIMIIKSKIYIVLHTSTWLSHFLHSCSCRLLGRLEYLVGTLTFLKNFFLDCAIKEGDKKISKILIKYKFQRRGPSCFRSSSYFQAYNTMFITGILYSSETSKLLKGWWAGS